MAQTQALHDALKQALKSHGITYAQVASALGLTEASVKRLFAEQGFSLQRLDQVCQLMDMEISDLVQLMQSRVPRLQQLTEAQEREIVSDTALLLVTVCVLNRWTLSDIQQVYNFTEPECVRKLAHLDRLRMIELLPGNRIKLRVAANFSWRDNGPIQRFFQSQIQKDFFSDEPAQAGESMSVLNGMLSPAAAAEFSRKLQRLAEEFADLNQRDAHLPVTERKGVTVLLSSRHWRFSVFAGYRRQP